MSRRALGLLLCALIAGGAAWIGRAGLGEHAPLAWTEVAPGIWRSAGQPAGYALVDGAHALLIDAPNDGRGLRDHGVKKIDTVLLTHYHRASCAAVGTLLKQGVPVRAAKEAAEWLTPAAVRKYWEEALPLRNSRTAYLVVPVGFDGIDCSLKDGERIAWRGWQIEVLATPGHARAHLAFAARKGKDEAPALFCGGALAAPGKMWAPYTTDWDHWTDAGLVPAAKSLRRLADLRPALLLPADAVDEVGFLKSYERFTKQRVGKAPEYKFLAKEQAGSNGALPWSHVAEHLYYTGNTWVLVSKEKSAFLVVDPWGRRSAEQIAKLKNDKKLGPLEVVLFSHAHYDHYDGVYELADRDRFEIWMLDRAATPVAQPLFYRAPFLDPRPVRFDRRPKDGETLTWREYRLRFHHLPGQTEYTMGVETTIDGKRCLFTADNWFHQDLYSGTGGWMGLNRSFPSTYAASAQKVIELAPEWVLAEHGGAFEYNAEDFRRRVAWGYAAAKGADALSPSGRHLHDWDPHRVHIEPLVQRAKPGDIVKATLVATNVLDRKLKLRIGLEGRGLTADQSWTLDLPAGASKRQAITIQLGAAVPAARQVFALRVGEAETLDASDAFAVIDVEK
jgi:glyoxylase-like metal-dependent hydrolase (beta-lactamase superfamily II)